MRTSISCRSFKVKAVCGPLEAQRSPMHSKRDPPISSELLRCPPCHSSPAYCNHRTGHGRGGASPPKDFTSRRNPQTGRSFLFDFRNIVASAKEAIPIQTEIPNLLAWKICRTQSIQETWQLFRNENNSSSDSVRSPPYRLEPSRATLGRLKA